MDKATGPVFHTDPSLTESERERSRHHHHHHHHDRSKDRHSKKLDESRGLDEFPSGEKEDKHKAGQSRSRSHHHRSHSQSHRHSRDPQPPSTFNDRSRDQSRTIDALPPSDSGVAAPSAPSAPAVPRKRKSNFDVKPAGLEDSLLIGSNQRPLGNPYDLGLNPIKSLHARRVYVGGVGDCTESDLENWFDSMITKAATKPLPTKPVVSVFLNREKRYSFVEFCSVEITTQVMGLNGLMFQGNPIKIRRPNDFSPSMLPPEDPSAPRLDLRKLGIEPVVETKLEEYTQKVIFGGIPAGLTERDLKPIFEAFGRLLGLQIFRDTYTLESKCYGYAEYDDAVVAEVAGSNLDGLELGESTVSVKKATPDNVAVVVHSDAHGDLAEVLREMGGQNFIPKQPTRVIAIRNVIPNESLGNSSALDDYRQDFDEECRRFGTITSMEIPTEVSDQFNFGIIYIEFEFIEEARAALFQLYGKKYKDRLMFIHYFDEIRYLSKDLSA